MAKTYTAAGTVSAGDVATAAAFNVVTSDINNLIVPPICIVRRVAAQSLADNTNTNISFDTEDVDTDGMFSPTSTDITIQTTGIYMISLNAQLTSTVTGTMFVSLVVNGTSVMSSNTSGLINQLTMIRSLTAADVVRGAAYQTGPATSKNTQLVAMQLAWIGRSA
jgi:hypothetical protein